MSYKLKDQKCINTSLNNTPYISNSNQKNNPRDSIDPCNNTPNNIIIQPKTFCLTVPKPKYIPSRKWSLPYSRVKKTNIGYNCFANPKITNSLLGSPKNINDSKFSMNDGEPSFISENGLILVNPFRKNSICNNNRNELYLARKQYSPRQNKDPNKGKKNENNENNSLHILPPISLFEEFDDFFAELIKQESLGPSANLNSQPKTNPNINKSTCENSPIDIKEVYKTEVVVLPDNKNKSESDNDEKIKVITMNDKKNSPRQRRDIDHSHQHQFATLNRLALPLKIQIDGKPPKKSMLTHNFPKIQNALDGLTNLDNSIISNRQNFPNLLPSSRLSVSPTLIELNSSLNSLRHSNDFSITKRILPPKNTWTTKRGKLFSERPHKNSNQYGILDPNDMAKQMIVNNTYEKIINIVQTDVEVTKKKKTGHNSPFPGIFQMNKIDVNGWLKKERNNS